MATQVNKIKDALLCIYPKLLFWYIFIFTLISPFDRVFPFSLKRISLVFFLAIFLFRFLTAKLKSPLYYFLFGFLLFVFVRTTLSPSSYGYFVENLEDFAYFACLLICIVIAMDRNVVRCLKTQFEKNKSIIIFAVWFCYFVFAISLPFGSSFDPGDKNGFRSFTLFSHSAATLSIFLIVLLLTSNVKNIFFYLPAIVFIYLTKARTFLVLL